MWKFATLQQSQREDGSSTYLFIECEDGKEEENIPSGWKFPCTQKYVLVIDDDDNRFLEY